MLWIALPCSRHEVPLSEAGDAGSVGGMPQGCTAVEPAGKDGCTEGWWALRFTPRVMRVEEALLLELSAVERLWGGLEALLSQLLAACPGARRMPEPWAAQLSQRVGPTAQIALALMRWACAGGAPLRLVPHDLPIYTLTALRPHVASLERMGCQTWGDVRRLPRAGVARRWGAALLHRWDQAWGDAPQSHVWLELPEQFDMGIALATTTDSAPGLLGAAGSALAALHDWLLARQQGVLALALGWRHDLRRVDGVVIPPEQWIQVRTAQPTHGLSHLQRLLAEHLARMTLAAPANHVFLRALETAPLPHASLGLLPATAEAPDATVPGEGLQPLLERLSSRLGADRVLRPVVQSDHRPEHMQRWVPAIQWSSPGAVREGHSGALDAQAPHYPDASLWPAWLLRPPRKLAMQGERPCYQGQLTLLAGPHRLEAGWWPEDDEAEALSGPDPSPYAAVAVRDYFVAHSAVAGLVWVFRERLDAGRSAAVQWFLHGIYA